MPLADKIYLAFIIAAFLVFAGTLFGASLVAGHTDSQMQK